MSSWFVDEDGNIVTGYYQYGYVWGLSPFLLRDLETHHFMRAGAVKDKDLLKREDLEAIMKEIRRHHKSMLNDIRKALSDYADREKIEDKEES